MEIPYGYGLINDTIILTVEGVFNEGIRSNNDSIGFLYDGMYNIHCIFTVVIAAAPEALNLNHWSHESTNARVTSKRKFEVIA